MIDPNTLQIDDDYVSHGLGGRPLYFQCTRYDRLNVPTSYGTETEMIRCGGDSIAVISFQSASLDCEVVHHVCQRHLDVSIGQVKKLGWEVVDNRSTTGGQQ